MRSRHRPPHSTRSWRSPTARRTDRSPTSRCSRAWWCRRMTGRHPCLAGAELERHRDRRRQRADAGRALDRCAGPARRPPGGQCQLQVGVGHDRSHHLRPRRQRRRWRRARPGHAVDRVDGHRVVDRVVHSRPGRRRHGRPRRDPDDAQHDRARHQPGDHRRAVATARVSRHSRMHRARRYQRPPARGVGTAVHRADRGRRPAGGMHPVLGLRRGQPGAAGLSLPGRHRHARGCSPRCASAIRVMRNSATSLRAPSRDGGEDEHRDGCLHHAAQPDQARQSAGQGRRVPSSSVSFPCSSRRRSHDPGFRALPSTCTSRSTGAVCRRSKAGC